MNTHDTPDVPVQQPLCRRCGEIAVGFATIGDQRYCHGDDQDPSCYERQTWEISLSRAYRLLEDTHHDLVAQRQPIQSTSIEPTA